jgi:putative transposase
VIQRGNNKTPLFTAAAEYARFAAYLLSAKHRHECEIHAYVFMTNHIHLLITPRRDNGIGKLMQSVGIQYVHYFNARHGRTGTLWEGRYRATLIDSDQYLLACYRYIELNPIRAGLASHPADYRWSSHAANALGMPDRLISPHPLYLDLARDAVAREAAYRALFLSSIDQSTLQTIRTATNTSWALGSESFRRSVGARLNRRAAPLTRGRQKRDSVAFAEIRL